MKLALIVTAVLLLGGCGDDDGPEPLFPADYKTNYTEVRNCRFSADHDLSPIVVYANSVGATAYVNRDAGIPEGTILVKEMYEFDDRTCEGPVREWWVARKLATGAAPINLDYLWQRVNGKRKIVSEDDGRCIGCHLLCGVPPDGYEGTCAVPP